MNVITGLMVDSFGARREEVSERDSIWADQCFVCGMERENYENKGLQVDFDTHLSTDHELWTYVYYLAYLKRKDPTEMNGIEAYVKRQVDNVDLEWIPSNTCFAIQDKTGGTTGGESTSGADQLTTAEDGKLSLEAVAKVDAQVGNLALEVAALKEMMGSILEILEET